MTTPVRSAPKCPKALQHGVRAVLFMGLCLLGLGFTARAQAQRMITFEAPGADTTGDNNGTYPSGINNWGAITGSYQDTNNTYHGFLRRPDGTFTTFEALGAGTGPFVGTSPIGINDLGAITGYYSDANGFTHGFVRAPDGKTTSFDVQGGGQTFPIAINLEGSIVGYYLDPSSLFHAFLRGPDGRITTFVGPNTCDTGTSAGCFGNEATNINIFGTSVGNYMDDSANLVGHGLIRAADGKITVFDAPGAGTGFGQGTGCPGCSSGFNQFGAIAATYTDSNNVHHGFMRSPGGEFKTFDAPGAGTGSFQGTGCFSDCPVSLNDWGAITGIYIDANFVYHGYLRNPEGEIVTVDPSGSVATLPFGINDLGEITGEYVDASNVWHGFLRLPD